MKLKSIKVSIPAIDVKKIITSEESESFEDEKKLRMIRRIISANKAKQIIFPVLDKLNSSRRKSWFE